jgi:hypothetical protein
MVENVQLLTILEKSDLSATYQPELSLLNIWTWVKGGLWAVLILVLLQNYKDFMPNIL